MSWRRFKRLVAPTSRPPLDKASDKRSRSPTTTSYVCPQTLKSEAANEAASSEKEVYFDYQVTSIRGDGRCLFRAVAHGVCLKHGEPGPDEETELQMADILRNEALDKLVQERKTTEWYIEGDFNEYVDYMRLPHNWGGEPELLMLVKVLQMPITVYKNDRGGVISIVEYGEEYGSRHSPIRILYHDHFNHYEALQLW